MARRPIFGKAGTTAFVLAFAVLLANGIASWWSIDALVRKDDWVTHTHEVLAELKVLMPALAKAKEGRPPTDGDNSPARLPSPYQAPATVREALDRLQELTSDNDRQQQRLARLGILVEDYFRADAEPPATKGREELLAQAQGLVGEMEAEERRLLQERDRESESGTRAAFAIQALSTALALGVLGLVIGLARREVRGRHRIVEVLRQSEGRFRQLADTLPNLVWMARADGYTDYCNRRWHEYSGIPEGVEGDDSFVPALHPEDVARCLDAWHACVRTGQPFELEYRMRDRGGRYRWHLGRALPIKDECGRVIRWFGTCTDIEEQKRAERKVRILNEELEKRVIERTRELAAANDGLRREMAERARAEAELQRAKEAAEAASRAKGEFLANMSHEVRTPMNGVLGMTELLLETGLSAEQREYVRTIRASAEALLTVINDILDFSKIEAGKLDLDPAPFRLAECLEDMLKPLAVRARLKGLALPCRLAPDVPDVLRGDWGRLRQVLVNLIGNAIKFTERGEVVVSVGMQNADCGMQNEKPDSGSPILHSAFCILHFQVHDTGVGIPADKLAAIFAPFVQADGSTTRRYGGTGLGLTISARLVEMMGGHIWAESEPGRGSVFHFTARLEAPFPAGPAAEAAEAGRAGGTADGVEDEPPRPLRILLAEDNAINRRIGVVMLEKRGHTVVSAGNGREALAELEAAPFDLVLMDVQMPEMDGLEATAAIRAREAGTGRRLPIIAVTAHAMKGDRERCLAAGMDGYVSKPLQIRELLRVMREVLAEADVETNQTCSLVRG